jgi:hypothetical protein
VVQQKLGHKDLLRFFLVLSEGTLPKAHCFVCCLQGISEDRTVVRLYQNQAHAQCRCMWGPYFGKTIGPWGFTLPQNPSVPLPLHSTLANLPC